MPKCFEYKCVKADGSADLEKVLNKEGVEGFKAIFLDRVNGRYTVVVEREMQVDVTDQNVLRNTLRTKEQHTDVAQSGEELAVDIEVEATAFEPDLIRLKFHGLPDDVGPDLLMNFATARKIVETLQKCFPESSFAR